jgi:hypothetical protein
VIPSPTAAEAGQRFDVTFDVTGLSPETQGSTKRVPRKVKGKVVWITTHDNDNLWPWRDLIVVIAKQFRPPVPLGGAVEVIVNFRLAVPKVGPEASPDPSEHDQRRGQAPAGPARRPGRCGVL